jgi:hypothetical protein
MHAFSMRALVALSAVTVVACAGQRNVATAPSHDVGTPVAASATPKLALRPAEEARAALGILVTTASPDALAAELDAFARDAALPLPLGQTALDMILKELAGGMHLSREQLSRLAPTESVAVVALFPRANTPEGVCAALSFKDAALAQKTLDELGPETARQGAVSARKLSLDSDDSSSKKRRFGDQVWAAVSDRTLLVGSSPEVLLAGGALAIEAQQAPRDGQIVVTVHPQAMAPRAAFPVLIEQAARGMDEELAKDLPAGKKQKITPPMRRLLVAAFKALATPVVDARSVRLSARLDSKNGFLVQTDVEPEKPGAAAHPFNVDATLPILDDRTAVFAMGEHPAAVDVMTTALGATGPAGKTMAKELETFLGTVVAGGSCAVTFAPPPMTGICVYPLRPSVTPKRALDGYAAMLNDVQPWNNELLGRGKTTTKVKRSKDLIEVETTQSEAEPAARAVRVSLLGGDTVRNAVTVRDGRLVQVQGPNPRELLEQLGARKGDVSKAPILASTLTRYKEAEGLFYFDFMSLFSSALKGVQDPTGKQLGAMMGAVPGLVDLRAPLVVTLRGGATTGVDVQIPFQSLANVAHVVSPFVGKMGAAP